MTVGRDEVKPPEIAEAVDQLDELAIDSQVSDAAAAQQHLTGLDPYRAGGVMVAVVA